jgi:uroporphyrinogen decarboxylase
MTYRDLFQQIMHYGTFDHMPVIHWAEWPETLRRWHTEGLPDCADVHEFLNAQPHWAGAGIRLGGTDACLVPGFEEQVYEETQDYRILRMSDGVICKCWKDRCSIPQYLGFTLRGAGDWDEYKRRLQPDPARIPDDLDDGIARDQASGRPVAINTGSLMGWIRNWMGVENMAYLMHDDPDVYADMVMTVADLVCWGIDLVLPRMKVDIGFGWEDICGRSGPLVSPRIFERCVAPGYRKIRERLAAHGVTLYGLDCDGDVTALVRPWLDAGINLVLPVEVGSWKRDAMRFRREYGHALRMIGNFDKIALERGRVDVLAEIERLKPLMQDGGFIITTDHAVTPGVSLDDYRWYLDQVRGLRL